MLGYHSPEYREAKLYKEGKRTMTGPYAEMADWIAAHFSVPRPLQIRFDRPDGKLLRSPWIDVIFDATSTAELFDDDVSGYDEAKQDAVVSAFATIFGEARLPSDQSLIGRLLNHHKRLPTPEECCDAFAIFSAFEQAAREEANYRIPEHDITWMEGVLGPVGIWKIQRIFDNVIFFFYREEQARAAEKGAIGDQCRLLYLSALLPYDPYGYFAQHPLQTSFASKEIVDREFSGNWIDFCR